MASDKRRPPGWPHFCARIVWLVYLSALVVGTLGCQTCFTPYDNCSPLVACPQGACDPYERAGSILAGTERRMPSPGPIVNIGEPQPEMKDYTAGQALPGIRILSITDRKLEDSPGVGEGASLRQGPQISARPDEPKPQDGWSSLR